MKIWDTIDKIYDNDQRFIFSHEDNISLDVSFEEYDENLLLSPCVEPDFDVNMLAFKVHEIDDPSEGYLYIYLYEWTGDLDVEEIVENIHNLKDEGYTIIYK